MLVSIPCILRGDVRWCQAALAQVIAPKLPLQLLNTDFITCGQHTLKRRSSEKGTITWHLLECETTRPFTSCVHHVCSKFFHAETDIVANKKIVRQTLVNPMFIFSSTCCPTLESKTLTSKTLMSDLLKFVPGVCSLSHFVLWQLHLNIYVLL